MTNLELGKKLVEYCNEGRNMDFITAYYSENIESVEAADAPESDMPRTMKGMEAIKGKNQWWYDNHEVHGGKVTGPFPHGDNRFAAYMDFDVTFKPTGQRMQIQEVGLYTTANGKVEKEEFFYEMP